MPLRHRALRPALLSLLAASVGFAPLLVGVTTPASAANTDIEVNEIVSDGPAPDSIELMNIGAAAVDVSGWILRDDKDATTQAIPAGTSIPAGGYLSIVTTFGLGNGDAARVFLPDGTTLVDGYTYPSHSAPSWSRCADGTGTFVQAKSQTLGAANDCPTVADLVINEVESSAPSSGPDWIEIGNPTNAALDASGLILRDNDNASSLPLPAGSIVPARGFLALDTQPTPSTGFGLGGADSARLFRADGTTLISTYSWTAHASTTYGRCPDFTGTFVTTVAPTRAAANSCAAPDTAVRINEVESDGGTPGDWVELVNTSTLPVTISGWTVRDDAAVVGTVPASTSLAGGAFYALDVTGLDATDQARLFASDGTTVLDSTTWTTHAATTYGRCPDGTGDFRATSAATKGTANDCTVPVSGPLQINEVRSNPGADFVELRNTSSALVDLSDFWVVDNDVTHAKVRITAESTPVLPGALVSFETDAIAGGFGLGAGDSVTIYAADQTTVVDTYSWTTHRTPSFGRCAGATGLVANVVASPGAENICDPVRINEIESSGGTPGDWVELVNVTGSPVDVSGWIFKDDRDADVYAIPAGTTIAANGYLVLEGAQFVFGLGEPDAARLFKADGTTLVDSYAWTTHAVGTTYGRCRDGLGEFTTTKAVTKGAANSCPPPYGVETVPWPGSQDITVSDPVDAFAFDGRKGDISGLVFSTTEPGVLWAVKNKNRLYKLTKVGGVWTPLATDGWATGKELRFAGNAGQPDAEGITIGPDGAIYTTSERDNADEDVAANKVLRFDPTQPAPLVATRQWDLQGEFADLDTVADGSNLGFEGVTWVPDSYLVAGGFRDEHTGATYDPATYAGHGTGLYVTALENDGALYAYALGDGLQQRVARIPSGFPKVMDVSFDPERQQLWAACDDTCEGQVSFLTIGSDGKFAVAGGYNRPTGMPNLNNEGFAVAPQSTCTNGSKEVVWSDDTATADHSLRSGTLPCTMLTSNVTAPEISGTARSGATLSASTGTWSPADGQTFTYQWKRAGTAIAGATLSTYPVVAADKGQALTVTVTATRTGYTTESATSAPVTVEDLPLVVAAPAITGSGQVGVALSASAGTWDEANLTFAYQWLRGSTPIAGATAASYTPTADDLMAGAVSVRVTASRAGGVSGAPATSAAKTVATGAAATASAPPAISGTARSGSTLSATTGSWTPASGLTFGYQWKRDGVAITGATAATYPVVLADKGKTLTVTVTAARAGYADGTSTATGVTVEDRPLLVAGPEVTGDRRVGSALTASSGTWDEPGLTYGYQWLRATSPIVGATSASYTLVAADLAAGTVSVVVTATRTGGVFGAPAGSAPVPVAAGDAAVATTAPQVSGIPVVGQTLTGSAGTWSAPGVVLELQWLRDGAPISGATGPTYRLVAADAGRAIALGVTAKRDGYADGQATSAAVTASKPAASKLRLGVAKSLKQGAKAKITVRVSGAHDPSGRVEVTLKAAGEKAITVSGRLSNGIVRLTSPKLDAGTYRVVASYDGDDLHQGDSDTAKIKVKAKKGR